jgi:phage terminase large subunit-like protein
MTGRKVWAGLDLGATKDMSGLAYLFEDGETDDGKPKFALCARGYMPAEGLAERAKEDQAPYPVWVEQGWLIATPGAVARLDYIARDLVEVSQDNDLQALAFDVWLFRKFQEELDAIGVGFPVQEHPQGFHRRRDSALFMPDSINAFETLILDGRLRVEVNPALRSAVMSAVFNTSPAGLRRFEKSKATARIDLCVGATQAVGAATASAEAVRVIELEPGGLLL